MARLRCSESVRKVTKMTCNPFDLVYVELPCGCVDVYYPNGKIDREHDHVVCDGTPIGEVGNCN